jgi:hypothetical protein
LVRSQDQVVASQVLAARSENVHHAGGAALLFPDSVKLSGLYTDFKVTLEIYTLQTNREELPHDAKYHIMGKKVCYIVPVYTVLFCLVPWIPSLLSILPMWPHLCNLSSSNSVTNFGLQYLQYFISNSVLCYFISEYTLFKNFLIIPPTIVVNC